MTTERTIFCTCAVRKPGALTDSANHGGRCPARLYSPTVDEVLIVVREPEPIAKPDVVRDVA